jgi:MFS family permease
MEAKPLDRRAWWWVVVLGLTGQIAWAVENMYLNLFVYETITDSPTVLAVLVAASAVAATVATLLAGAASDRVGRRRVFIAGGYVLWGGATAAFGLVGPENAHRIAPAVDAVLVAIIAIVALDCLMSVLGATANDAAFNAWVTDTTDPSNRGRVDGVLATMPLLAMLIVFGALDPLTRQGRWDLFFGIVGAVTAFVGLLALVGLREAGQPRPGGTYVSAVLHGLRPSTIRRQPALYITLGTWALFGVSTQIFLPYLIIYVQRYLDIAGYAVVLAAVLLGASLLSILGGRVLDRIGASRGIAPAVAVYVTGLGAMFFVRGMLPVIAAGIVVMAGMMLTIAALSATVRNHTPTDRVGQVQGLRMVAAVLVPMVVGPFIGAAVILGADETFVDLGVVKQVPTPWIFPAAAVVALLVLLPARALLSSERGSGVTDEVVPC